MITIIAKRGIIALTTIFVGVLLTFVLFNIAPGDPCHTWAMQLVERQGIPYELAYKRAVEMWGYDPRKPIYQRFIEYIKGLLHGDLGYSRTYQMSTNRIIAKTLPWTVFVVSISLLLSFSLGIILGALIAWRRKGVLDSVVTGFASIMSATPAYLIALILLAFLGVRLKWFPVRGAYDITFTPGFNIPFILNCLYHGALPILSYVLEAVGGWTLAMKGSTISVLGEDYITAARARGLKERRIAISYAGRNSILPLVTSLAISLGAMFGGAVLVETVFSYPGIGRFFALAVGQRDFGAIQGLFFVTITAMIVANFLADLLYAKLDPRIRLEK